MKYFLTGIVLVSILAAQPARAEAYLPPTDVELMRLPPFCTVKMQEHRGDREALRRGLAMIGPQFANAHHYCNGVNFLNRYYSSPFGAKAKSNLAAARSDLTYMVDHLYENSSLDAESYLYRGIVNSLMKNDAEALTDLQQAVSRNPRLTKAYLTLADFYKERKQQTKALEVVTEGLRQVPDSKALQRRYKELGGKLPFPEPVVAEPVPEVKEDKPVESSAEAGAAAETSATQAEANAAPTASTAGDRSADQDPAPQGIPKKSWCRFCPDE